MKRRPTLAPGIRRHGAGWQVCAEFRRTRVYLQFPLATPLSEMQEWQKDAVARLRLERPAITRGTFPADVRAYLQRPEIQRMPTYQERAQHLGEWSVLFHARRRHTIQPGEIAAQRDLWFYESRGPDANGHPLPPYAAASVNKRLRALSNLWTVLDGRRAHNPVLEVAECEEPDPQPRGLPYDVIDAILAAIPEVFEGLKKDGTRTLGKGLARPSRTKARLRVIAYTGLSHSQLMALQPSDVDLEAGTMRLVARRKGRKLRRAHERPLPDLLPLLPPAVAAFRDFDRLQCWGRFSPSSMWKAFQRACRRLGLTGLRPYDFRHAMGSLLYGETRDLRVTGRFLGHRSDRTTRRYTLTAVAPHVAEAAAKVQARLAMRVTEARHDEKVPPKE